MMTANIVKTIHYTSDIKDKLIIYVPMRRYELTLKHRLLNQLGSFSHLILRALAVSNPSNTATNSDSRGLELVSTITGLTKRQLLPVLTRLQELRIIDDYFILSPQGHMLVKWLQHLHDKPCYIWLDAQYRTHNFWCNDTLIPEVIDTTTHYMIDAIYPDNKESLQNFWGTQDWNEDCERQKRRLLEHHYFYFSHIFNTFHDCFGESDFFEKEWELNIKYSPPEVEKVYAISCYLSPQNLYTSNDGKYKLLSPVLCLETNYSLPDGFPSLLQDKQPENTLIMMSFSGVDFLPEQLLDESQCTKFDAKWCWPNVDETDIQNTVSTLLKQINHLPDIGFNRQYHLSQKWQPLSFNRDILLQVLKNTKKNGLFFIGDQDLHTKQDTNPIKGQTETAIKKHTQRKKTKSDENTVKNCSHTTKVDRKAKQSHREQSDAAISPQNEEKNSQTWFQQFFNDLFN